MTVQTKNIQEVSVSNSQYIVNRVLFESDTVYFVQEDQVRVADKLVFAITDTGYSFMFVCPPAGIVPHDIEVAKDGSLFVNTATAPHDLTKYTLSEISSGEYVHEAN